MQSLRRLRAGTAIPHAKPIEQGMTDLAEQSGLLRRRNGGRCRSCRRRGGNDSFFRLQLRFGLVAGAYLRRQTPESRNKCWVVLHAREGDVAVRSVGRVDIPFSGSRQTSVFTGLSGKKTVQRVRRFLLAASGATHVELGHADEKGGVRRRILLPPLRNSHNDSESVVHLGPLKFGSGHMGERWNMRTEPPEV